MQGAPGGQAGDGHVERVVEQRDNHARETRQLPDGETTGAISLEAVDLGRETIRRIRLGRAATGSWSLRSGRSVYLNRGAHGVYGEVDLAGFGGIEGAAGEGSGGLTVVLNREAEVNGKEIVVARVSST